eukprot:Rmarinus@m.21410
MASSYKRLVLLTLFIISFLEGDCRDECHEIESCSGFFALPQNFTCVHVKGYAPESMCTIYYRTTYFRSLNDWLDVRMCFEVYYEDISVADDILVVLSNGLGDKNAQRIDDNDVGAYDTFEAEGIALSLISNAADEGRGFRVHFGTFSMCGDGIVQAPEECDSGERYSFYACDTCCKVRAGYLCENVCGRTTSCIRACGDGVVQSDQGEECDDANTDPSDGCFECLLVPIDDNSGHPDRNDCDSFQNTTSSVTGTVMNSYAYNSSCMWVVGAETGNGLVFALLDLDFPNEDFLVYSYPGLEEICQFLMGRLLCGDFIFGIGDYLTFESDQVILVMIANADPIVGFGLHVLYSGLPSCGDGVLGNDGIGLEMCDDGNRSNNDGCSSSCLVESMYTCSPVKNVFSDPEDATVHEGQSFCHVACGDGVVEASNLTMIYEECDDGNLTPSDGCTDCFIDAGYICSGSPSKCEFSDCGNGFLDGTEECDDANEGEADGCFECLIQPLYECEGQPSVCTCVRGAEVLPNGTCAHLQEVSFEVGRYDESDCDCWAGDPSRCCLHGALETVYDLADNTKITICLHTTAVHLYRGSFGWNDTLVVFEHKTVYLRPCTAGEMAIVDLGFMRSFLILLDSTASMEDVTLRYGYSRESAVNIIRSDAYFRNVHFERCVSRTSAPAISLVSSSSLLYAGGSISNSMGRFGAISAVHSNFVISDVKIFGTLGIDGALYMGGISLEGEYSHALNNMSIIDNVGLFHGAAWAQDVFFNVTGSFFHRNFALSSGAVDTLHITQVRKGYISNCIFSENGYRQTKDEMPFGTYMLFISAESSILMTDTAFMNNTGRFTPPLYGNDVGRRGGAVAIRQGSVLLATRTTFVGNEASLGGAVYVSGAIVGLEQCMFRENVADQGGAIFLDDDGSTQVDATLTTFEKNLAECGSIIYISSKAIAVFRTVESDASRDHGDVFGALKSCSDMSLCGQNAVCVDKDVGVTCECGPRMRGDPHLLCYGETALSIGLLGTSVERTLRKPGNSTECILLSSTGGLGYENKTVNWNIVNVVFDSPTSTVSQWMHITNFFGTVEAGYCGTTEDLPNLGSSPTVLSNYDDRAKTVKAAATSGFRSIENEYEDEDGLEYDTFPGLCTTFSSDEDHIGALLSTRGLTEGKYKATIVVSSDSDLVPKLLFDVTLSVLTFADGTKSKLLNVETQACSLMEVVVNEATEYMIQANDLEGLFLGHGGEDVAVHCMMSPPLKCGGTGLEPPTPISATSSLQLLSVRDYHSGKYRVALSFRRSGVYWVSFQLNGVEISNSPIIVRSNCPEHESADSDGVCHVVLLFSAGVLLDTVGILCDWFALLTVYREHDLLDYRHLYAIFVSIGTLLVLILVLLRIKEIFFSNKSVVFKNRWKVLTWLRPDWMWTYDSSLLSEASKDSSDHGDSSAHDFLCLASDDAVHPFEQAGMRNLWGIAVAILKDVPIVFLAAHISFTVSDRFRAIIFDACMASITAGCRFQNFADIFRVRKHHKNRIRAARYAQQMDAVNKLLAEMSLTQVDAKTKMNIISHTLTDPNPTSI